MNNMMNKKNTRSGLALQALAVAVAAVTLGASGSACAQSAGTWSVAAGIKDIAPHG